MEEIYQLLVHYFGLHNVKIKNESEIMIRPMWIEGGGIGYQPTLTDMTDMMESFFQDQMRLYNYRKITRAPHYPYYLIEMDQEPVMITIHHSQFFYP